MTDLVAADIGGTHARFALAKIGADGAIALGEVETLRTSEHPSLDAAWETYRARMDRPLPPAAALAFAGPVASDKIQLTNNSWHVRLSGLEERLGVSRLTVVNDFEAVGHAVARADQEHFLHLAGPDHPLPSHGMVSILGPGTGLGVAHLARSAGSGYRVQATEGGHIGFAPLDAVEDAILARLRERLGRVSVERVVSGPGIVSIYRTLAELEGRDPPELDDVAIWQGGLSGEDDLAVAAIERFCLALGSLAGDIALVQGGFGGVVIAGGLGYRIRETLRGSGFARRFVLKGRYEELMATIPVKLITHPQPGLFGAAAAFACEHLETRP
jgi:glucokinase